MAVAYKVDAVMAPALRRMIKARSIILANLVLGDNAFPELIQERCTPANLAQALAPLIDGGPVREAQVAALAQVPGCLLLPQGTPSEAAADIVLRYADGGRTSR